MSGQVEELELNIEALKGVQVSQSLSFIGFGFQDEPTRELVPVILRLHQLWKDNEAHRIIQFFYDNSSLLGSAKSMMGLDVLNWGEAMYEAAVEDDNFNKLFVLALAQSFPPIDDAPKALKEAIESERYGMVLALLATMGDRIAPKIGSVWIDHYKTLAAHKEGVPYACAQILNGTMAHHARKIWKADLPKLAETIDPNAEHDVLVDYLEQQGQVFGMNPTKFAVEYMGTHLEKAPHQEE